MKIHCLVQAYDLFGGNSTISLAGDYLAADMPVFGSAIQEITVVGHFRSEGPPRKTLESSFEEFHASLASLPKVTFRRKKHNAEIHYPSELLTGTDLHRARGGIDLDLFKAACREIVQQIALLKKRVRRNDDFDFAAFQSWLDNRMAQFPSDQQELEEFVEGNRARRELERSKMSPWEKLGLDFDEFHPDARNVLDDPFFWSQCDYFSPNGNDTGADVLSLYQDWRKKNRKTKAITFFRQLMRQWDVIVPPDPTDDYSYPTYNDAIVGLAFAQLKFEATCSSDLASLALDALGRHWGPLSHEQQIATTKIREILERYT